MKHALSSIRTLFGWALLVLALTPILGPPLYVEVAGGVAPGAVAAKREAISPRSEI